MRSYSSTLTQQITWAFVLLGFVIAIASVVGLHYLEGIRVYQHQFEDEWEEYQRMVAAEDILKEISMDINKWEAGMIPVGTLKKRSDEITRVLSSWVRGEDAEDKTLDLNPHEQQEARLIYPAKVAFVQLTNAIAHLQTKPSPVASAVLINALNKLQQESYPLRQFYFKSIQVSLEKAQRARSKAEHQSIYFVTIVVLLVLGISIYSIRGLKHQTRQLMEQERQIASVELVQCLAHEIRNPLGIMKSAASVIVKHATGESVGLAEDIVLEVERVDGLLTDLLHLRQGKDKPKELADVSALVLKVSELFAPKIKAADLRLDIINKAPGVFLLCRPEAIKQMLMNLLLNAIEASSPKAPIEITMLTIGQEYVLQVRDHGVGLQPEHKQKIFDLMYTTKPYGFGIGLTVVKRIVEDHDGRIEVGDAVPEGTLFSIYLPVRT